jgi:hypothetical protein
MGGTLGVGMGAGVRCPRCDAVNPDGADSCGQWLMRFGTPIPVIPQPKPPDRPGGRSHGTRRPVAREPTCDLGAGTAAGSWPHRGGAAGAVAQGPDPKGGGADRVAVTVGLDRTPPHPVRYHRKARRRCSLGRGLAEERGMRRRPPGDGTGWRD